MRLPRQLLWADVGSGSSALLVNRLWERGVHLGPGMATRSKACQDQMLHANPASPLLRTPCLKLEQKPREPELPACILLGLLRTAVQGRTYAQLV